MGHKLADYKIKHVPGLYHYTHYEHDNGSFIQKRHGNKLVLVHFNKEDDKFRNFNSVADLKAFIATL